MSKDTIYRRAAIDALMKEFKRIPTTAIRAKNIIEGLPSTPPEITGKNVLEWLLAYQTKSFELHGRYKAHEVIGWLIHDISNILLVNDGSDDVKGKENG